MNDSGDHDSIDWSWAAVQSNLSSSSTKRRISELKMVHDNILKDKLSDDDYSLIFPMLFRTFQFYTDRRSRQAIQLCLQAIFLGAKKSEQVAPIIDAIVAESSKISVAPASAFVLAEWCSVLLQCCSQSPELWNDWGEDLVLSNALVLDFCLRDQVRGSMRRSLLILTRRAYRTLLKKPELREQVLKGSVDLLTSKSTGTSPVRHAPLLGVIAGVAARIPEAAELFVAYKQSYTEYYVREILNSRTTVPHHTSAGLSDFFMKFVTLKDLQDSIIPAVAKALLRAPEVVLNGVLYAMISSLDPCLDLSNIMQKHLLKLLLSNIKSSNTLVRDGAFSTFKISIARCQEEFTLDGITESILDPLKTAKLSAPGHKILHAQMLLHIEGRQQCSEKIVKGLIITIPKETNEMVLQAEVASIVSHLRYYVSQGLPLDHSIQELFSKGLSDKKPQVRKIWTTGFGDLLWREDGKNVPIELSGLASRLMPTLKAIFDEILGNPLSAVQSGLLVSAYALTALSTLRMAHGHSDSANTTFQDLNASSLAFASEPKRSFLLNYRLYTKLTTQDDQLWLLRALGVVSHKLCDLDVSVTACHAWAQAFIFMIVSPNVPWSVRQSAASSLSRLYHTSPVYIGPTILNGVWQWWRQHYSEERDSIPTISRAGLDKLHLVLRKTLPSTDHTRRGGQPIDQEIIEKQLVRMLVLCRPGLLPHAGWIELCQLAGQDPGELASRQAESLMREIISCSEDNDSPVRDAAYHAAAELAFVSPDTFTPVLIKQLESDFDPEMLSGLGPEEAAIYHTPEGVMFKDVLAKQGSPAVPDKNVKDYDILKWEADLRAQLSNKKGQDKKLTKEEHERVEAQLEKERKIRSEIGQVDAKLRRGLGIVKSLGEGPPSDVETWIHPVLDLLVCVGSSNAVLIERDGIFEAYVACSAKTNHRLGPLRPFIGIATLRALGVSNFRQQRFLEEPLQDLVSRLLYKIRFLGEQRQLDLVSFSYLLPLVLFVLDNGGIGTEDAGQIDEQIVLAIEVISTHASLGSDKRAPRGKMFSTLIAAMQRYAQHYKIIKDCFMGLCSCATNLSVSEIQVLLRSTIVSQSSVRNAVLQALLDHVDLTDFDFIREIWIACYDSDSENSRMANDIWDENALETESSSALQIMPYLETTDRSIRNAASRALAAAVDQVAISEILSSIELFYKDKARPIVPQFDQYGIQKKSDLRDPWEARSGTALAFLYLTPKFQSSQLQDFLKFLIEAGPLADRHTEVRTEMLDAATCIVAAHGKEDVERLMGLCETTLEAPDTGDKGQDVVNEAVIILYGALARHLQRGDKRVPAVVERLLATLETPSETVQLAVAQCLPPLIVACPQSALSFIERLVGTVVSSKRYASQRGAAYGLAGILKGRGLSTLHEFRMMTTLKVASENKKDSNARQGALMAYELFSLILGRTFEPYVIQVVPQLLTSFGDSNADVREACLDTAKTCFANLSSFGVKQILPTLLEGLDESQWRSKKGACDLLGAMAYLDPQQLASSLPDIIPPLTNVLNDSHKEVRNSANTSLQRFGEVIGNPEVKEVVSILLKALSDPTKFTESALDSLIKVSFIHYLDAPSLALIVRILERGLGDRSGTKRKSSQIIASLAHLTERKDLISYLPVLVAGLKLAVVDPVPTTRATSSKALGSLIEKLGEDALPDLIPSLMSTLKSDAGAGDRLGSAQALSEVLAGLGTTRLEQTLPTILQNVSSSKAIVREGFMSLFIFLPACFGNSFATYLGKIIPPILSGLADETESIRETSLRAGRLLVKNFASRAVDLLLPELERGLADDSYRIRLSSVELVGDLLFNLTGISATDEEDEIEEDTGQASQSLLEVLGEDKRNKILSSLYICRCDTSGLVRSAAIAVWKALVASPRTLKELIPTLTQLLIRRLASPNMEHKVIAGNALGELIRKAGEGVLSTLLPTLEEGLQTSTDSDASQGICIALRELVTSASRESLEEYEGVLISIVRLALVDKDDNVREAAAEAFDSLQRVLGKKAVDQVLPYLLNLLRSESDAENALSALLTLLTETTRSNIILPNLIPTLLAPPISSFNAKALAALSGVAGSAMNRRLPGILNSLMNSVVSAKDSEQRTELEVAFSTVLLSVDEFDGLNTAMNVMLGLVKHEDHRKRAAANEQLVKFFNRASIDFSRYYQDLVRVLLISFDDHDAEVVKSAWSAMNQLCQRFRKEDMESLAISTRHALRNVGVAGSPLPGFGLPKGIGAILPIFLQALMNGTADQRTQSALAISDIIDRSNGESLKPFVTQITGPLIRVVSERSVEVKAAILLTLNNLLEKIPTYLKPFLPQLQRTFAKSLADPSSETLRTRAAKALGTLITMTPRVDPLIAELVSGSKTPDAGVRTAMLKALYEIISTAGNNMSENSRNAILGLIDADPTNSSDALAIANARLLGALIKVLPKESSSNLIKNRVLHGTPDKASILALNATLVEAPDSLTKGLFNDATIQFICQGIANKDPFVSDNSVLAAGKLLSVDPDSPGLEDIFSALAKTLPSGNSIDLRRLSLVVLRTISRQHPDVTTPSYLSLLAPPIFASVRDPIIPIKLAAEAAFITIFRVIEEEGHVFETYMADTGSGGGGSLPPNVKRSMSDYFRRVALRLGAQARERREAEGGQGGLGLSADEKDDEREVWSIGTGGLGEDVFGNA